MRNPTISARAHQPWATMRRRRGPHRPVDTRHDMVDIDRRHHDRHPSPDTNAGGSDMTTTDTSAGPTSGDPDVMGDSHHALRLTRHGARRGANRRIEQHVGRPVRGHRRGRGEQSHGPPCQREFGCNEHRDCRTTGCYRVRECSSLHGRPPRRGCGVLRHGRVRRHAVHVSDRRPHRRVVLDEP